MKPTKLLVESGSGCCLLLPLLSLAATANPLRTPEGTASSDQLPYPIVGLEASDQAAAEDVWPDAFGLDASEVNSTQLDIDSAFTVLDLQREDAVVAPVEEAAYQQLSLPLETVSVNETVSVDETASAVISAVPVVDVFATAAVEAVAPDNEPGIPDATVSNSPTLGVLSVELRTDSSQTTALVKGAEDGRQAVAFSDWLLPVDDVTQTLGFVPSVQADGRLSLQSSEIITYIYPERLREDAELGQVWSISEIESQLGVSAEFDRAQYTIYFNRTALNQRSSQPALQSMQTVEPDWVGTVLPAPSANEQLNEQLATVGTTDVASEPELADQGQDDLARMEATTAADVGLGMLLVGLAVDDFATVEATLIKGREDESGAIAFEQWLIPFDDAMAALGISVSPQPDGQLGLRSPGLATQVNPADFPEDPDLGTVISIATIEERLGIPATFSRSDYAINFLPPPLEPSLPTPQSLPAPVDIEGLALVTPRETDISSLQQTVRLSANSEGVTFPSSQLTAVGSLAGGSWYARLSQPELDYRSWQLEDFQYLEQQPQSDYVVGSQPTFWQNLQPRSVNTNDFWGVTRLERWGFESSFGGGSGGFSPLRRMNADSIGRTIAGAAPPGTLVQLTKGLSSVVIDETVVDSSGVYRFDSVPVTETLSSQTAGPAYQVRLYADGLLTNPPEIRSANLSTVSGQLPQGASALVASAGVHRDPTGQSFLGGFERPQVGLAFRHGMSESLTLGTGLLQGEQTQMLTEAFYLPEDVPLQAAISALVSLQTGDAQVNADIRYRPTQDLRFSYIRDRFSDELSAVWEASPGLSLIAEGDMRDNVFSLGANAAYRVGTWYTRLGGSIDTRQNFRWSANARNRTLSLTSRGNEISTYSELAYQVPAQSDHSKQFSYHHSKLGHELALSYETYQFNSPLYSNLPLGALTSAHWRYRSHQLSSDGGSAWTLSAGYGFRSNGSGPIMSASLAVQPGLNVEMRYQGVSAFSDDESFQLSLVSRLRRHEDLSGGFGWGNRQQDQLRTQGGLIIQPFFDSNANGQLDADEALYTESPELLIQLNQSPLRITRQEVQSDGIAVVLPPDTYRLDIDPAGLPLDSTVSTPSYAAEVIAGQYTTVRIPLSTSYTLSGVVTNVMGEALAGARVEAISASGHRQISVSNGAGVYYLEKLKPETYEIIVNGVPIDTAPLSLETEPFQARDLHLL